MFSGIARFKSHLGTLAILIEIFHGLPQPFQAMPG
jgi:hypothetical protein